MCTHATEKFEKSFSNATRYFRIFGLQYFSFDSTAENKDFNHHGSNISRKFKLAFVVLVAAIAVQTSYLIWNLKSEAETGNVDMERGLKFGRILMMFLIEISLIHSLKVTPNMKLVFRNLEKVMKIFNNNLNVDVDYTEFLTRFNKLRNKMIIFFIICSLSLLITIFNFNSTSQVISASIFVILPYFYMKLFYLRFIFFTMLIKHNIEIMKKVVERLETLDRFGASFDAINFYVKPVKLRKSHEIYYTIITLKEIYGIIWKTTETVNELSGPSILIQFFINILVNISACFKIYLAAKGVIPFIKLGSKSAVIVSLFH